MNKAKLIDEEIANSFMDFLTKKGLIHEDEEEIICIFEQLVCEQIENNKESA